MLSSDRASGLVSLSALLILFANPGLKLVGAGTGWRTGHVIGVVFLACERPAPTSALLGVEVAGLVATGSSSTPSSESGSRCCFPISIFVDIFKIFAFTIFSDVFFLEARRAQTVVAVHDGLGPQVAVLEVAAGSEVHVEVRAVDVVGCFDVAHYEKR
jgi:hypothetical protein